MFWRIRVQFYLYLFVFSSFHHFHCLIKVAVGLLFNDQVWAQCERCVFKLLLIARGCMHMLVWATVYEQIHYKIFAESITQWLEYNINKQTKNLNECRKNAIVCYFYMCSKLICKITTNNNLKLNWLVDGNPMGLRNCLVQ